MGYQKSIYKPKNPKKYKGDPTKIVSRSSWERKFMVWCDHREDVIEWSSEETVIPYRSPLDGRIHRYFVDFKIRVKRKDGSTDTILIEIKPKYQTEPPKKQERKTKRYINEVKTYAVNHYKWKAAREYCKDRNYKFQILTEKELGISK